MAKAYAARSSVKPWIWRCGYGFQALSFIRDVAPETDAYVATVAGMIGLMGGDNRGLGICVNTLPPLNHMPNGLPVAYVTRSLTERPDVRDAVQFLT